MSKRVILLSDRAEEQLRKDLLNLVEDPRKRHFEQLRGEGFDSETAADLAGLNEMHGEAKASIVLDYARHYDQAPAQDIQYTAVRETHRAVQTVGAAAGAAAGTAATMSIMRFVSRHGALLRLAGVASGGVVAAIFVGKIVAGPLGTKLAAVAVTNVVSATILVATALWKTK